MPLSPTPNIYWKPDQVAIKSKSGVTINTVQAEYLRNLIKSLEAMYNDIANAFNVARADIDTLQNRRIVCNDDEVVCNDDEVVYT